MQLDLSILEEYLKITGSDISLYLSNALTFFSGDYNTIVNYYSGNIKKISSTPFANFDYLKQQHKDVMESFKEHSRQLNNLKWWLLLEQIEEIDNRLNSLSNINKWARSSLTKVGYDPSFQVDYVLRQNQTLENVAASVEGSQNPNDDWVDIALSNRMAEEDYTKDGGNILNLTFGNTNGNFKINAVVDVISGKSIYGKDIDRHLQFDPVTNDLKCLGYDDTILQAVEILSTLRKNDNPDNPEDGLQTNVVVGGNKAALNFPVIIRQLQQTFANDDTLKNLQINKISTDQDNFTYEFNVQTRLNETIKNGLFN